MVVKNKNLKEIGQLLFVKTNKNVVYEGYLLKETEEKITLKLLDNGYNIDIFLDNIKEIKSKQEKITPGKIEETKIKQSEDLPNVLFIATGGTIGTHVDYTTGAVSMSRTPEQVISVVPDIVKYINLKKIISVSKKGSEDVYYKDWQTISNAVYDGLLDKNIDGIIISHGTDTLSYTSAAISLMIENINKPILLVGAQKSPDRASFDGSFNLLCASRFISTKTPGVFSVMHGSMNDDFCDVIYGTKVYKLHTSRRDAFKAINDSPVARVFEDGSIKILKDIKKPIDKPKLFNSFEDKTALVLVYPNQDPKIIDWYIENNYKGLVLVGTGLGHLPTGSGGDDKEFPKNKNWLPYLKKANDKGLIIIMCSQCLFGRVNNKVYSNLRFVSDAGVEYLNAHDMLYSVAYIKLAIALKKFSKKEDVIKYLETNISGEITKKELPKDFEDSLKTL
jgi:glutamyl-tRNA(Gln) amidotransferase subunit D